MPASEATVMLGRIVGVHGVRGMVKIHSECRPREDIFRYRHFFATPARGGEALTLTLSNGRVQGLGLVATFAEIRDRDQAMALRDYTLSVARSALPALPPGEFYWADLMGMPVVNRDGVVLGKVHSLFETGANDVLVVKNGAQEILIPFALGSYILDIDMATPRMTVDWDPAWSDEP